MKIKEIFEIDDAVTFINELCDYLDKKRNSSAGLSKGERLIDFYYRFMASKDMDGFGDLFYQAFSLEECKDVIRWFSELGLDQAARHFREALDIYCRRRLVTSEEYNQLDPFDLEEAEGRRFDEIGKFFDSEECGLYGCEELIKEWMSKNRHLFT